MPSTGYAQVCHRCTSSKQNWPFVQWRALFPLSRVDITATLRQLLHDTNAVPSNYASHSFRIGAATTAAAAGLPPAVIKTLGRWKSNAYETYIQY